MGSRTVVLDLEIGKDDRGYLDVSVLGLTIKGLLDSGSSHCLVGLKGCKALEAAGLKKKKSYFTTLRVASKHTTEIAGEFQVPFALAGECRVIPVLYVPLLSNNLILGIDFWKTFNIRPDFVNRTVEIAAVELLETAPTLEKEAKLTKKQREQLDALLKEFQPILETGNLGKIKGVLHTIDTGNSPPVKTRYANLNPKILKDVHAELEERLRLGVVEPSDSPWLSPLLPIAKRDGSWRWVVDFRKLNEVVQDPQQYPLPRINPMLSGIGGAGIISTIDIKDAYLQICLSPESKPKTAFYVPGRGLFQFTRLPAGLVDAANRWQRTVESILTDNFTVANEFCKVYMDDVIVWSPAGDWEHHLQQLRAVFQKFADAGVTLNLKKSKFARKSIKYLGHIIDEYGVRPDPEKIAAVVNFPRPRRVTQIRQFLGLAGWMRRFIEGFSIIAKALHARTQKNASFVWGPEEEEAFLKLKEALCKGPVLRSPDFDKRFRIYTDGSAEGTGAILVQEFEDGEHVIAYSSKCLKGREKNFSATELECLGVLHAVEAFRPFVEGYEFDLVTDHSSLQWLRRLKNPTGRLARWAVYLQQYKMNVIHRSGAQMKAPDALSRNPWEKLEENEPVTEEKDPISALVDLPEVIDDNWYNSLLEKVRNDPDSYEKFKVDENGNIFKLITVHPRLPLQWVQAIPRESRLAVLRDCHDNQTSGHGGWYRTFQRLRACAYWPGMKAATKAYVRSCNICQRVKKDRRRPPGLMGSGDVVSQPFELLSADLIGPFPRSSKQMQYIHVIVDAFSKYCYTRPLRKATANAVAQHLKDVMLQHGAPRLLLVDNGAQYTSKQFKELCSDFGVKIRYNIPYNPRSNPTERLNQTLETLLCCYIQERIDVKGEENHRSWDVYLPEATAALNSSVSEVTGVTPHQILFGESLILDGRDRVYHGNGEDVVVAEVDEKELQERRKEQETLRAELKEKIKQAKARNALRYNLRRRPGEDFRTGDLVMKRNFAKSDKKKFFSKKLTARKLGPFKIKERLGRVTYLLEDSDGEEEGPCHLDQLTKYTKR